MTNIDNLPALPEDLLSAEGPIWSRILDWYSSPKSSARKYADAIDNVIVTTTQAYAREAVRVALEAGGEPLFLLRTGQIGADGEQDDFECEPDRYSAVETFCQAYPGQTVKLYASPQPDQSARIAELESQVADQYEAMLNMTLNLRDLRAKLATAEQRVTELEAEKIALHNAAVDLHNQRDIAARERDEIRAQIAAAAQRGAERMREAAEHKFFAMQVNGHHWITTIAAAAAVLAIPTSPAPADSPENKS